MGGAGSRGTGRGHGWEQEDDLGGSSLTQV